MPTYLLRITGGPASGSVLEVNGSLDLGRDTPDSEPLGEDPQLSRLHARVTRTGSGLQVEDLGSTNGTFVNGSRINGPRSIGPGDQIQLGDSTLEVVSPDQPTTAGGVATLGTTATAAMPHAAAAGGAPATTPVAPPPPLGPHGEREAPTAKPREGGGRGMPAVVLVLLGLLLGAGIVGAVWALTGSDSDSDVEQVSLMAQGFSNEVLDEESGQREIVITMRTFEAPYEIRELRVHKFLDETRPPPQRTYDAIYTFTAQNGDTLVLSAAGDVTNPEGPDAFFGQTHERWRVVEGTGVFEDARGEGTITTAVNVAARDEGGSNVVKHIEGDLEVADQ